MPRTERGSTASKGRDTDDHSVQEGRLPFRKCVKQGAKAGVVIASIAILSLSIYAIAVPAAIATIAAILITIAKLSWAPTLIAFGFGLVPLEGSLGLSWEHSIGFMLIIAAAAVAMSSILSLTALPVIGPIAPLINPIALIVISASILTTMIVTHVIHRRALHQENQQHKEDRDRWRQETKTGSRSSKDLDMTAPLSKNKPPVQPLQKNLAQQAAQPIAPTSHTARHSNARDTHTILQRSAVLKQFKQQRITVDYNDTEETSNIQRFIQLEQTLSDQEISIDVRFTNQPASCMLSLKNNTSQPKQSDRPLWCCLQYETNSATQEKTVYLSGIYEALNRIWQNHPQCPSYREDYDAQGSDPLKTLRS